MTDARELVKLADRMQEAMNDQPQTPMRLIEVGDLQTAINALRLAAHQDGAGALELQQWIVYADALEAALRKVADLSDDQLKRMQATEGLRLVRPEQQQKDG